MFIIKIFCLKLLAQFALKNNFVAKKTGLIGPMAATILEGRYKGMPLGLALLLDKQQID